MSTLQQISTLRLGLIADKCREIAKLVAYICNGFVDYGKVFDLITYDRKASAVLESCRLPCGLILLLNHQYYYTQLVVLHVEKTIKFMLSVVVLVKHHLLTGLTICNDVIVKHSTNFNCETDSNYSPPIARRRVVGQCLNKQIVIYCIVHELQKQYQSVCQYRSKHGMVI